MALKHLYMVYPVFICKLASMLFPVDVFNPTKKKKCEDQFLAHGSIFTWPIVWELEKTRKTCKYCEFKYAVFLHHTQRYTQNG